MWLILSITAGILFTLATLLNKKVLKDGRDPWIFTFFFSITLALVSFPIMLLNYKAPEFNSYLPWLFILGISVLFSLHNFLNYTALKHLSASVHGTFYKLRLVWAFLIAVAIGQDSWTLLTVLGIIAIISAGALLLWKKDNKISILGILLVSGSSMVNAGALVLFKYSFEYFGVETAIFITAFLPALFVLITTPKVKQKLSSFTKQSMWIVWTACLMSSAANFAIFFAIQLGQVTAVLVTVEAFLIFILVGERIYLKDTQNTGRRVAAIILAIVGAACILAVRA